MGFSSSHLTSRGGDSFEYGSNWVKGWTWKGSRLSKVQIGSLVHFLDHLYYSYKGQKVCPSFDVDTLRNLCELCCLYV